ncbi:malate dehydrogenase [Clostridium acetobutylicum]|nr:malate dehydrogenase [Clostridium acetobutylicum]
MNLWGDRVGYSKYKYEGLLNLCLEVFKRLGYTKEDSYTIGEVLLLADLFGIESHGVQRLTLYYKGIRNGSIKVKNHMNIVKESPVSVVIDGDGGMGQIISKKAMERAIDKAKKTGIGMAIVKNSNHFGIAGYYSRMAERKGLMGIAMTNTRAIVLPTYGREQMLGTNPISIAMPARPIPFLLDMATSVITRGKVEVYSKNNQKLNYGWAMDDEGRKTDNPDEVLKLANGNTGGLLPLGGDTEIFGGHKGYGISFAVEMFTSILSGGLTSDEIRGNNNTNGVCHAFAAIDYGLFDDKNAIEKRMSAYMQKIRNSKKAYGASRIYTHGEKELEAYEDRMENGIPINENTIVEIKEICDYVDIDINNYLKKY